MIDQLSIAEFLVIVALVVAVWRVWWTGTQSTTAALASERERAAEGLATERRAAAESLAAVTTRRDELVGQLDALGKEADDLRRENLVLRAPAPPATMSAEEREKAKASTCVHCGGVHAIACPRVRTLRFRSDGTVLAVEFWPDNEWPKDRVLFLEDYAEPGVPEPTQGA